MENTFYLWRTHSIYRRLSERFLSAAGFFLSPTPPSSLRLLLAEAEAVFEEDAVVVSVLLSLEEDPASGSGVAWIEVISLAR